MKQSNVLILAACGIMAVAGGWYFGTRTEPAAQTNIAAGTLMFPGLANQLASVTKIEVAHQGTNLIIEKRPDSQWGIASMHDYPIQDTKLRGLLTGLTELTLGEPRTSDPSEYARLGVEDPNNKTATSNLLTLIDASGKPIASVILGHRRVRSQGDGAEETYVRRPNDSQSWIARGSVEADADPNLWLDRNIININHDRIASVDVNDHALVFGKVDGKFALTQPTDHPKLEDYKVDDVSRALELLTLEAVKADADLKADPSSHAVFTTTDGMAMTIQFFHAAKDGADKDKSKDPDVWARFTASGPASQKAEIDKLNQRVNGWSYEIGAWKEQSIAPTLADLKAEEPAKPAASAAPATPDTAAPATPPSVTSKDPSAK
jgi:Domain of unknown function (DUF4340)